MCLKWIWANFRANFREPGQVGTTYGGGRAGTGYIRGRRNDCQTGWARKRFLHYCRGMRHRQAETRRGMIFGKNIPNWKLSKYYQKILERRPRRSGPARPERLLWGDRPAAGPSPGRHRDRPRPAPLCQTGSCPVRAGTRPMRGHSQTKHYAVQQLRVTIGLNVIK